MAYPRKLSHCTSCQVHVVKLHVIEDAFPHILCGKNLPERHAVVKVDNIFRAASVRLVNAQHQTHSLWTKSAKPISAAATLTLLSPFRKFVSTANTTATSLNTGHTCWAVTSTKCNNEEAVSNNITIH